MLLDAIEGPADLRTLSYAELDVLSAEIRDFIVRSVSATGGHLGSNLGTVELTLALHRVFDTPRDILLWDIGHQAYVHKVVTGRRCDFGTLRQEGGLSGYLSREESEFDWIENSHASTVLSYAHGVATAVELGQLDRQVIAVIGDGAMTGGMAYEGLNNFGVTGRRAVIVLNDNGRSYAPTHSKLGESLSRLRLNPSYTRQRARFRRMLEGIPFVGRRLHRGVQSAEAAMREMWEPPAFFEQLGVRYTGPIDGHDIEGLEKALRHAAEWEGPIVVHVLTHKGRGYPPAEAHDEHNLHDVKVFDPLTGPIAGEPSASYTAAFSDAVVKAGEANPSVVAITAAMPGSTGLLPFQGRFPDRFVDVGIAEAHAVTAAAGMALLGLKPVVALYSTFVTRAFDQVNLDVGLHGQPVVFAIDRAGITGDNGASHHGVLDMALLTKVPGMTVFAPSSLQELEVMFDDALAITGGPSAIRWPNTAARQVGPDEVGSGLRARLVRRGSGAVAILAVGKLVAAAEEAAGILADRGIDATVWDVRVCKPLDPEMIADAAAHSLVVTAEDGIVAGSVGSQIVEAVAAVGSRRLAPPSAVLGTPVDYIPHGKPDEILAALGLDAPGIAATVEQLLPPSPST